MHNFLGLGIVNNYPYQYDNGYTMHNFLGLGIGIRRFVLILVCFCFVVIKISERLHFQRFLIFIL